MTEYLLILVSTILVNNFVLVQFLGDRKSTRLNSSHVRTSYAVCCLKQNLKIIRRGTRLVCAAAQQRGPGGFDSARGGEKLLARFHRAWPGDHHGFFSAHDDSSNVNL